MSTTGSGGSTDTASKPAMMTEAQRVNVIAALAYVDRRTAQRFVSGETIGRLQTAQRLEFAARQVAYLEAGMREGRV